MNADTRKAIVVTGASGLQGGTLARQLLREGWHVRALTRKPGSRPSAALAADPGETRAIHPEALGVRDWLRRWKACRPA